MYNNSSKKTQSYFDT